MPEQKRLVLTIWEAFKQSLKRPLRTAQFGDFKGKDYMDNKYYELPARPEVGRRKPSRWFESNNKDLMQEVPPEWESWLRNRRDDPPTEEEIIRNRAIHEMKKKNSGYQNSTFNSSNTKREERTEETNPQPNNSSRVRFPRHADLEMYPGQSRTGKD